MALKDLLSYVWVCLCNGEVGLVNDDLFLNFIGKRGGVWILRV